MAATKLEELLEVLAKATEAMRTGDPADVQRVHDLVGAMGQSFTTTIFAFQQVSTVKSAVHFAVGLAQKSKGADWVNIVAEATLRNPCNAFRTRYGLLDTADLHERGAELAKGLEQETLVRLLRRFIEYHNFLARRIRDMLPFYELSIAFEGHRFMTEKAVPPGASPR